MGTKVAWLAVCVAVITTCWSSCAVFRNHTPGKYLKYHVMTFCSLLFKIKAPK